MSETFEPTGPDAEVLKNFRRMVSMSPTFQEKINGSAGDVYDRGHYRNGDAGERPQFFIGSAGVGWDILAGGPKNFLEMSGQIGLMIEVDPDPELIDENDIQIQINDFVGNVMKDIASLAGADDYVAIESIRPVECGESPVITQASSGRFFWQIWSVGWRGGVV